MSERSEFVRRLMILGLVALILGGASGILVRPASADTGVEVKGTFILKGISGPPCVTDPDGTITCWPSFTGVFNGGIEGAFYLNVTAVGTPDHPDYTVVAFGTLDCAPCTVAGLSGKITFSTTYLQDNHGRIVATLEVEKGFGGLRGVEGTGSWTASAHSVSQQYLATLILPG